MSILSQTVFDPLKAQLGADVAPIAETLFSDLTAATQKFTSALPNTVAGQSGALALNSLLAIVSAIGPALIQAELAKVLPTQAAPAAQGA